MSLCESACLVFSSLTVDIEGDTSCQVSIQVIEICGRARVHTTGCALDRFQHQKTTLTNDGFSLKVEGHVGIRWDTLTSLKQTHIYMKCTRTSLMKSNSGCGFPSVSHFMFTVSPSFTGSLLRREKVAFSEGSRQTWTDMEQMKIPPLDTFTQLQWISSIRDVQNIPVCFTSSVPPLSLP